MEAIKSIEYKGCEISIYYDETPLNPRVDWDNMATMVCKHSRYILGDEQFSDDPIDYLIRELNLSVREEEKIYEMGYNTSTLNYLVEKWRKTHFVLPLYLYDHSGITISTGSFACKWDSGQIGWIVCSFEDARKWHNFKKLTAKRKQLIIECMEAEVQEYDQYLTGEVYGFIAEDENGNQLDSCWGFFGDIEYPIEEAKGAIDCHIKNRQKDHFKQLKTWIKNNVPLDIRQPLKFA